MTTLYPVKGSASWNKSSGIITASGLTPPGPDMSSLGVGNVVTVVFDTGNGGKITINNIVLYSWQCTPSGWAFSGKTDIEKDLIGEYLSIFECLAQFKSESADLTLSEYLESLITYDESHTRKTSSPYAVENTGWWRLNEIVSDWAIPSLANSYISSLSMIEYTSSVNVINSFTPLINQLFFTDAFTKSVSMIPKDLVKVAIGDQDITVSDFLDLRTISSVDLTGNKGNPTSDPRENGVGGLALEVRHTGDLTGDPVTSPYNTELVDKWTNGTWITDSNRQNNYQRLSLYGNLGSKPTILPDDIRSWIKDLVVPESHTSIYDDIVDNAFELNIEYFDRYNVTQDLFKTVSHTFIKSHQAVSPFLHSSSLPVENVQIVTRSEDKILEGLIGDIGISKILMDLESLGYTPPEYPWLEEIEDPEIGIQAPLHESFNNSNFLSAKVSNTVYTLEPICEASNNDISDESDSDTVPYLFERSQNEVTTSQAGPFLLNLDSMFWVTPGAELDVGALDPRGTRVWIGPFDDPKKYAMLVPTILTLYRLFKDHGTGEEIHESLCIFAKHGNLLKEADIVIAAICDELSKDPPLEYVRRFDEYYNTVNNWFDGQFARMNGLQYSYAGSHSGLGEAIAALAEKQGVSNIDSILERILPGSRVADAQDRAGGAYCKDMTKWMAEHGIIRMAYGVDKEPEACEEDDPDCEEQDYDRNLVRFTDPLIESRTVTRFSPGMIRTENYNIRGDVSVQEVPVDGHPELVFIPPRYIQISTIESGEDDKELESHQILPTKVMRWNTLYTLRDEYIERLLGKRIMTANKNIDYSDDSTALPTHLADCFSDITIRNFKLTVAPDCTVGLDTTQLVELDEEE